jgi:hypothetical protein
MGPRIAICRKGENIFLTIEGEFNCESSRELLSAVRHLLMTSLKCVAPGSRVTYCLKTRGKVDPGKIASGQQVLNDPPSCEERQAEPRPKVAPLQEKSLKPRSRNGLILIKGGAY